MNAVFVVTVGDVVALLVGVLGMAAIVVALIYDWYQSKRWRK